MTAMTGFRNSYPQQQVDWSSIALALSIAASMVTILKFLREW